MQRYVCATCVVLLVVCLSLTLTAQAPPSADAYVTSTQPSANFGGSSILPVQAGTTSYIRLNLGVIPANSTIAKATLRLYVSAVAAPGSFDVYQVGDAWSEGGISYNRAPALGSSATGGRRISVTAASRNQFILVDITSLAQGWANGSIPNNGVALALTSAMGSFSFDSKESLGRQPELEIVLGSPAASSAVLSVGAAATPNAQLLVSQQAPSQYINNGTVLRREPASTSTGRAQRLHSMPLHSFFLAVRRY